MDRLDFEELDLRSIDLSLSPSVADLSESKKEPLSVRVQFHFLSFMFVDA